MSIEQSKNVKQFSIKTRTPIEILPHKLLEAINKLRREHAHTPQKRRPILLDEAIKRLNLFSLRDAEHSMLTFKLSYSLGDRLPCVRAFPNYGINVKSVSTMRKEAEKLILDVNLILKAGRAKWHFEEITECYEILISGKYFLELEVILEKSTDSAGYSQKVDTLQDLPKEPFFQRLPPSMFLVEAI